MKKLNLLLIGILVWQSLAIAQEVHSRKHKVFKARVTDNAGIVYQGIITSVAQDSLTIHLSKVPISNTNELNPALRKFNYDKINTMTMQRKGSVGRGAWIGGLIGLASGVIIGLASGDDPPEQWFAYTAGEKAVILGLGLGTTGCVAGMIIGAVAKKKFVIGGKKEAYDTMRGTVLEMTYGKPSSD